MTNEEWQRLVISRKIVEAFSEINSLERKESTRISQEVFYQYVIEENERLYQASRESNPEVAPIDPETYCFDFGRHKGLTYYEVYEFDARYIEWAHNEVPWFFIEDNELEKVNSKAAQERAEYYRQNGKNGKGREHNIFGSIQKKLFDM